MERPAARQGRVSHQSLAQRRPGLPPLDPRPRIRDNKPYDRFVRELLTASGSNFRVPPVNFYRAMQSREPAGHRPDRGPDLHGRPRREWPKERLAGWPPSSPRSATRRPANGRRRSFSSIAVRRPTAPTAPATATFPDGTPAKLPPDQDPREVFADWLIAPKNPWFARNIVNRVWYWLLGRGIVHEPDDIRPDNPPANPELLAYLEKELIALNYDLKHIYRLILNSQTYQLSSIARSRQPATAGKHFAYYPLRRLEAEVLIDALCQITGTTRKIHQRHPRAVHLHPRQASARSPCPTAASAARSWSCSAARRAIPAWSRSATTASPPPSALHLLNSSHIQRKIEQSPKLLSAHARIPPARELVDQLYLTILSRYPTDDELKQIAALFRSPERAAEQPAFVDLAWALINSSEFLYRH